MNSQLIYGKCEDKLQTIEKNTVDLLATDPPYGISFLNKKWDISVPPISVWKECLRILKPGAFAFVMSSPRQDVLELNIHHLHDAGFDINFSSIYWTYSSGMPKAQNISKIIDKKAGIVDTHRINLQTKNLEGTSFKVNIRNEEGERYRNLLSPVTMEAKSLDGSYAGFQPKPAVEIIIVAMKPLSEKTYAEQALKNSHGVTWLDEGRIPYVDEEDKENAKTGEDIILSGRFPANLLVEDNILNEYSKYFNLDAWGKLNITDLPISVQETFPFVIIPKVCLSDKTNIPHPTIKPLMLMRYLITLGSRRGDIVIDPYLGSGTTSLAALELGRKYIGIEMTEEYYKIASQKLKISDIGIEDSLNEDMFV